MPEEETRGSADRPLATLPPPQEVKLRLKVAVTTAIFFGDFFLTTSESAHYK